MTLKRFETNYGHGYTLDGKRVKGVTTLINQGLPKPGLTYWAARSVAEYVCHNPDGVESLRSMGEGPMIAALKGVPWQQRDEAAAVGTEVHHLAEQVIGGKPVEVPDHLEGHVRGYAEWLDTFDVEEVMTEFVLGNRQWSYAGTCDALLRIGGRTILADLKTAKGVYGDNALQVAMYANAEFYLDADGIEQPMPAVDGLAIVHVTPTGTWHYEVADPEAAWKDALHVAWVARAADRIKNQLGDEPVTAPQTPIAEETAS